MTPRLISHLKELDIFLICISVVFESQFLRGMKLYFLLSSILWAVIFKLSGP